MADIKDNKDKTPNQNTIDMLEGMLAHAKSGALRTIVCLKGWDDDAWNACWSIDHRSGRRKMIGEMTLLYHDIVFNQALDDGDTAISGAFDQ